MKQEWKVLSNPVNGDYIYQVYRIKDPEKPMHSGNIETTRTIYHSLGEAEAEAARQNRR